MRTVWRIVFALSGAALISGWAHAEGVRVRVQAREVVEGQGWLFRDPATGFCGVVTAAHVVAPQGKQGIVTLVAAGKGEGVGAEVRILSPAQTGLDVALIRVEGGILEHGCTSATLGSSDLGYMLNRSKRGVIEQVSIDGQQVWQDIEFFGANIDDPTRLALRPTNTTDEINEGYSGSPITEAGDQRIGPGARALPLAMITEVIPGNQATAVRFDTISGLVRKSIGSNAAAIQRPKVPPSASAKSTTTLAGKAGPGFRVVSSQGETADLGCPLQNAGNSQAACGWRARPLDGQRSIAVVLAPDGPVVSHIEVSLPQSVGSSVKVTAEVAGEADSDNWTWAKSVISASGTALIDFQPLNCARVRLTFSATRDQAMEVRVGYLR